jgi:predicted RNA-binding Zn ribbon-like protein
MSVRQAPVPAGLLPRAETCIDFVNTAGWHASDHPVELLTSYGRLVGWAREHGLLPAAQASLLEQRARREPSAATSVLTQAITLREAAYRVITALVAGSAPRDADLTRLNRSLTYALRHLRLAPGPAGLGYAWGGAPDALDCMLWPLACGTAGLLTSGAARQVGMCANHPCGWLFIDRSHGRTRRWCDMRSCGNRTKVRRHYARRKSQTPAEEGQASSTPGDARCPP